MDLEEWFQQVPALRALGPVDVEQVKRRVAIEEKHAQRKAAEEKHERLNTLACEIIISMDGGGDYACASDCCEDDWKDVYPA